jgi:hypothetical protein
MRVLIVAKEGNQSEAATPPTPEAMAAYEKFNGELVKAGVVLEAGRLYPSSQGKRVRFEGKKRTVIDGPFAETKELVAGYWLWQVRSIDEALEWLKRAPYDGGTFDDVGTAEELAQDALVAALEQWPVEGVPERPAAWLMWTAKCARASCGGSCPARSSQDAASAGVAC